MAPAVAQDLDEALLAVDVLAPAHMCHTVRVTELDPRTAHAASARPGGAYLVMKAVRLCARTDAARRLGDRPMSL